MSHKIFKNVKLGKNVSLGDFVIIGLPTAGKADGDLETVIGDNSVIRSHTVIYAGNRIGSGFSTGHRVLIRENNKIGNNVSVGSGSNIEHDIEIGDNVRIHSNVFVPEFTKIKDRAWIGPGVAITNILYPICKNSKKYLKGPTLEEDAKIGANSTILPRIKLGRGCLVGCGSVVTKDVPEGMMVVGNPAKVIKKVEDLRLPDDKKTRAYG